MEIRRLTKLDLLDAGVLLNEYRKHFEQNNARYVTLETSVTNKDAQNLYEKMDMHVENEVYHYIKYL
ncbi:MAG: hypothetical protein RR588_08040 [Solibacillus sp.]